MSENTTDEDDWMGRQMSRIYEGAVIDYLNRAMVFTRSNIVAGIEVEDDILG